MTVMAGGAEQPVAVVAEVTFGGQTLTLGQHASILSGASIAELNARHWMETPVTLGGTVDLLCR